MLCGTGCLRTPLIAPRETRRKVVSNQVFGKGETVGTIKGFWQHSNGKIYAVENTTFGEIIGGVGPLDPDDLRDLDDYDYKTAIVQWLDRAVADHKLHRINPPGR
jgi:hypothetical protein